MQTVGSSLTIFFDDPYWVGVFERMADGRLEACKVTFGAQPKDYEVYDFILRGWGALRFSPPVDASDRPSGKTNPKRVQRSISRQLEAHGTGTKSQQALKLQREAAKATRKERSRQQKDDERQRRFALRTQKRKQKHRGR